MAIAEILTTIAENQQKVYDAGYEKGKTEGGGGSYEEGYTAGQRAEYNRFWDAYQDNDGNYFRAFASGCWTDETYDPKVPIVCTKSAEFAFNEAKITNTKVPIEIRGCSAAYMFTGCYNLATIPYIGFFGATSTSSFIASNTELVNITVDGEIATDIGFASCYKLSDASVQSIIDHLADLTGQTTQKLTFHATVGGKLTDAQKVAITAKNWTLAY